MSTTMSSGWVSSIKDLKNHVTIYNSDYFTTFILKGKHNLDISLNEIFQDEYDCCMINYNSTLKILSIVCTSNNKVEDLYGTLVHKGGIDICCPDSNHQSVWILNGHTYRICFSHQYKCVLSIRTTMNFSKSDVQIHAINLSQPNSDRFINPQLNGHKNNFSMSKRILLCCLTTMFCIVSILLFSYSPFWCWHLPIRNNAEQF